MDESLSTTLLLHIPPLLPHSFDLEIGLNIQSAAIVGAGLIYKGTSHRLMTEMMLSQIPRKPLSDKIVDREIYSLSAGFALGLVNLGSQNKAAGLSDLGLDNRLIRLIEGGKMEPPPVSMLHEEGARQTSSAVWEGDLVNTHITVPGALFALALIYLKSGNLDVARRITIPDTFYTLEFVRPDHLLLKVVARALIMWESIEATTGYLYSCIPYIIRQIYELPLSQIELKFPNFAIGEMDYPCISLCYVNILTGSILALGLRFAGTANQPAFDVCNTELEKMRRIKVAHHRKGFSNIVYTDQNKSEIDKETVEKCVCIIALSMSLIMAGTGNIECLKQLRVIRKHLEQEREMHYGYI